MILDRCPEQLRLRRLAAIFTALFPLNTNGEGGAKEPLPIAPQKHPDLETALSKQLTATSEARRSFEMQLMNDLELRSLTAPVQTVARAIACQIDGSVLYHSLQELASWQAERAGSELCTSGVIRQM